MTTAYSHSTSSATVGTTTTVTQSDGTTTWTMSVTVTDALGRTMSVTDETRSVTSYTYSDFWRTVTETLPGGQTAPARKKLVFAYGSNHRRIAKAIYAWDVGSTTWALTKEVRFVHDEWQMIAELDHTSATGTGLAGSEVDRTFLWGPDLSGSMTGAGGVGGLLSASYQGITYEVCSDANGNVTGLVPVSGTGAGTLVARFDDDPLGNRVTNAGPSVELCPFGFSSKYLDTETGVVSYELRGYLPGLWRWMSRDPMGERGGINLYGMVGNDPVNKVDYLGMAMTGKCEVVLFVGHTGDVRKDLDAWNWMHKSALKKNPSDPSVASGLSCALPMGVNSPWGIPGFVSGGNGLIGYGSDKGDLIIPNGGMTAPIPRGFEANRWNYEAFGFLKLYLTNCHAGLKATDNITERLSSDRKACCDIITFRLIYSSDDRTAPSNRNITGTSLTTFGSVNVRGAYAQLSGSVGAVLGDSPSLQQLPSMPSLQWNDFTPPSFPTSNVEVIFSNSY